MKAKINKLRKISLIQGHKINYFGLFNKFMIAKTPFLSKERRLNFQ